MMTARFALCLHVARAATRSSTRVLGQGLARSLSTNSDFSGIKERTLVAVKPDGVQRRLIGEIIKRFEQRGFRLVGLKMLQASDKLLAQHYVSLQRKPFYSSLLYYMTSGPIVAMVWEGHNVVRSSRKLVGETDPAEAAPGTIRGDFSVHISRRKKPVGNNLRVTQTPRHVPRRPSRAPAQQPLGPSNSSSVSCTPPSHNPIFPP